MPLFSRVEFYFIVAMMFLIIVLCTATVYFFIKTYKKEMREKEARLAKKREVGAKENAPPAT
jgi:hypothetical protein